jgi:hypothetical protein
VNENVLGAVFGGDEAKTFGGVEELDGAGLHGDSFPIKTRPPGLGQGLNDDRKDQQTTPRGAGRVTDNRFEARVCGLRARLATHLTEIESDLLAQLR